MGGESPPLSDVELGTREDGRFERGRATSIGKAAARLEDFADEELEPLGSPQRRNEFQGSQANRISPGHEAHADGEAKPSPGYVVMLLCGHALSASLLLVVNKWALRELPYVWILTTMQFVPAVFVVGVTGFLGLVDVDRLSLRKLWAFLPAAGMFFITLTAGNAVVKHSNVDTFIVMRALVPIPAAFLETLALGEPCPRPASWAGLCMLLLGAMCYASLNRGLAVRSSAWMCLFLVMMPVDAVLIKHLINTSHLSPWGLVLYQNLLAGTLGILCSVVFELSSPQMVEDVVSRMHGAALLPVLLSCILGISVSFFQMKVRKAVSSTAFMVLGVCNKLLALLISQLSALEANSNVLSILSVLLSIFGAVFFQQTVKGKGLSTAPPPSRSKSGDISGTNKYAFFAMLAGLSWAAALNLSEKAAVPA